MDPQLQRIDAKISALLAIMVDRYLRETEIARPKQRTIDRLLSDVGLPTKDIAKLLGKTERAVQLQLEKDARSKQRGGKDDDSSEA